jgi:hypothetical protein
VVCLDGAVVIVDTPLYHDGDSGKEMVRQREAAFQRDFGFPSNALANENYLTYQRLDALTQALGTPVQLFWPVSEWRWFLRRWRARWRGHREPAQFPLIKLQKLPGAGPASLAG